MKVYKKITSLYDFKPWSGAVDTYNKLIQAGKQEKFIDQLAHVFAGEDVSETEINNMLWFVPEECFKLVGLDKDGNEKSDEEEEEDEDEN